MSETAIVRVVRPTEASAYFSLRLSLLRSDPLAYCTSALEYAGERLSNVAQRLTVTEHSVTYGAYLAGELVGILTLKRPTQPALSHRAEIVGVGVLPAARGYGCAKGLIRAAIAHARRWEGVTQIDLSVTETQHAALRLYEHWGFVTWGVQPAAFLAPDGKTHALHHLTLRL